MKSLLKIVFVLVFTLGTTMSYATVDPSDEGTKKVKVVFSNVNVGDLIYVKDANGRVLHKEVITEKGLFHKIYDFSGLENGNYEIDLSKDSEVLKRLFSIESNALVFKKDEKEVYHKPFIQHIDNRVKVSKLNTVKTPAEVVLLFNDEVIFTEKLDQESEYLSRLYKLDKSQKGNYTVIVHSEGKSYEKKFSL